MEAYSINKFRLTDDEKIILLKLARNTIKQQFSQSKESSFGKFSENLLAKTGVFVSLHKKDHLRGCVGTFGQTKPLYRNVLEMSKAAAFNDPRFKALEANELHDVEIELSVLTPMQKIDTIDQIELGKHGIYIKQGYNSGTFLPQVVEGSGWTKEEFLGHCARDKAYIGWDGWKSAEIYIYEAIVFSE